MHTDLLFITRELASVNIYFYFGTYLPFHTDYFTKAPIITC